VLGASSRVRYLHEPFNLKIGPRVCDVKFPFWYTYVCADNEAEYVEPLSRCLTLCHRSSQPLRGARSPKAFVSALRERVAFRMKHRNCRALMKDPGAVFSTEWLADRFGMQVVVLVRHPAAVASSHRQFNWRLDYTALLQQDLLFRDHLEPFRSEIELFLRSGEDDLLDNAALMWKLMQSVLLDCRKRHPQWIFVRHEDLSFDPPARFRSLAEHLGVPFDQQIQEALDKSTSGQGQGNALDPSNITRNTRDNLTSWRHRLRKEEIHRIRRRVEAVSSAFYNDDDW
jgi:hypothetical protein